MTIDLIPTEEVCRRANISVRRYQELVAEGRAPAPVKGVPAPLARAWLDARGAAARPLPPGDFIRITELCDVAGIEETNYYAAVRKSKAPRQLKGIQKKQALEWLRAWTGVAAAKEKLEAVAARMAACPQQGGVADGP